MNAISKQIGVLFSTGKQDEAKVLKAKTIALKESLQGLKQSEEKLENQIKDLLFTLPNVCTEDVPKGKDETSNEIIEAHGTSPSSEQASIPHWDLAKEYALMDQTYIFLPSFSFLSTVFTIQRDQRLSNEWRLLPRGANGKRR